MAAVSSLVQDIISDIPEIPKFVAERQYLRALRTLCEQARVWRVEGTITATASPELSLESELPNNTELVDVISIKLMEGGAPVKPTTQSRLDIERATWRELTGIRPESYVLFVNNTIRLVPYPSESIELYYRVAVKPAPDLQLDIVNDVVVNKYNELIIHGAKAFLFMTPRKPWTDLQMAQYHQAKFELGIPDARSEAADEFQTGVARKVKYGGY